MLAEDDIFLAEALPILCVTFLRGGWGGGAPEKRTYDVSHGQNQYVRLPYSMPHTTTRETC
jgi:hypothetical protein